MTILEASKILGMTEEYVRRLCTNGKIKGAMKFGRAWAIPRSSIKLTPIPLADPPRPPRQDILKIINEAIAQAKKAE